MTGDLILGDGIKLELGNKTGGDLAIYHDGSHSYVRDGGTGDLLLQGRNSVKLQDISGENYFVGTVDGSAELYHNNTKRIDTNGGGIGIYSSTPALSWKEQDGTTKMDINFGANATDTAEWNVHPAKDIRFRNNSTTTLTLKSDGRGLSQFTAKAWINWDNTGTLAILDSHNVSSVTDNAVGNGTVVLANNMANVNYCASVSSQKAGGAANDGCTSNTNGPNRANGIDVHTLRLHGGSNNNGFQDVDNNFALLFGD